MRFLIRRRRRLFVALDNVQAGLAEADLVKVPSAALILARLDVEGGIHERLGALQVLARESLDCALVKGDDIVPGGLVRLVVAVDGKEVPHGRSAVPRLEGRGRRAEAAQ